MNKMMKKAMAAAMALTIVGGGLPTLTGGTDIFKPSIVANAATKEVTVAKGACFQIGDTLNFGSGSYVYLPVDNNNSKDILSGTKTVDSAVCKYTDIRKSNVVVDGTKLRLAPIMYDYALNDQSFDMSQYLRGDGSDWDISQAWGFIVLGEGTNNDPYYFEILRNNPDEYKPIVGKVYNIGDGILPFDTETNQAYYFQPKNDSLMTFDGYSRYLMVKCDRYDSSEHTWCVVNNVSDETIWFKTDDNRHLEVPIGVKIVAGSGKENDPFILELAYEREPSEFETVTIGKKWYAGDLINTDAYFYYSIWEPEGGTLWPLVDRCGGLDQFLKKSLNSIEEVYPDGYTYEYIDYYTHEVGYTLTYEKGLYRFEDVTPNGETVTYINGYGNQEYQDYAIYFEGDGKGSEIIGIEIVSGSGTKSAPFHLAPIYYEKNKVKGASLTLDSDIGVNFYTYATDEVEKAVLSGPDGDITINKADFDVQADGSVKLTYPINATQTESTIKLQLYGANNKHLDIYNSSNEKDADGIIEFSAQTYFENAAPDSSWSDDKKTAFTNLVTATQSYADISEAYFSDGAFAAVAADEIETVKANTTAADFTSDKAKLSLVLDSKLAARIYIDDQAVAAGNNATYKKVGTTDETTITAKANSNGVYFEIPDLLPTDLNTEYVVTFGTKTYTFSALSWAKRVMENPDSSDKNKAMANVLYQYYTTANAFANS